MKLLLVGNESTCPDFIEYANERRIELTVVPEKQWHSALTLVPSDYHEVLSFSDTGQVLVERIKKHWNISGRGEDLVDMLTNKKKLREQKNDLGLFSRHILFSATDNLNLCEELCQQEQLSFPLVVKPASGFYSAGVSRVDEGKALSRAISLARRINNQINGTKGDVIIEEYLAGEEIAIDGIIHEGTIYPLIYHTKHPKLEGPFFHEEAYISQTYKHDIFEMEPLRHMIQALGLTSGPFHIEMRQCDQGKWYLLECAPRFSGMGVSTNIPFFSLTSQHAYDFLLWPHLAQAKSWHKNKGYVIEFDFAVKSNATLLGIEKVREKIHELPHCRVFQYANNGDAVLAPPNNLNALLTVFCHVNSLEEALNSYQILKELENSLIHYGVDNEYQ